MLLVLFELFFTQIAQNSRIFSQARKQIIPLSSHLSTLSCDVAHRFPQILKIYDSFRFKAQGYTLRVEI